MLVVLLAAAPDSSRGDATRPVQRSAMPPKWIGTWHLIRERIVDAGGNRVGSLFDDGVGRLTYTRTGEVWALTADRGDVAGFWYTGAAQVDRRDRTVTHHVKYSNVAAWIGTDLVRGYRFFRKGTRLRLTAALNSELTDVLTWRRPPKR